MRLRHIVGSEEFVKNSKDCIDKEELKKNKSNIKNIFKNDNEIHIEIGMGKGKFLREMSKVNKDINFIGIERYESVLMKAIQRKERLEEDLDNLKFLPIDAKELEEVFEKESIAKIYLNFSDPWPKLRHEKRRLTYKSFLDIYHKILKKDGILEFKTDNKMLFEYSIESIKEHAKFELLSYDFDIYKDGVKNYNIMTEYEEKFSKKNNKICKLIAKKGGNDGF